MSIEPETVFTGPVVYWEGIVMGGGGGGVSVNMTLSVTKPVCERHLTRIASFAATEFSFFM